MKRIVLFCLMICMLVAAGCSKTETPDDLYNLALRDSAFADEDEILPLVEITKESSAITWNQDYDKVFMLSWHNDPNSYKPGEEFTCTDSEIWTFTDKEIIAWYSENKNKVTDWELRLKQLIGLPPDSDYTHFSAFWVEEEELIRPAYQTNITQQLTADDLDGSKLGEFKNWFDDNIIWSYFDSAYPWTRLGYTYDWAENETEYGLSEFIILKNAAIEVEFTLTTQEFIVWLEEESTKLADNHD